MGANCVKSCYKPKKKYETHVPQKDVQNFYPKIVYKSNDKVVSQLVQNNNLTSSESNLLNWLRKEKARYPRPQGIQLPTHIRNKPLIRFSSWNVNGLSYYKLQNAGILSVICLTILENNISLISLQEVTSKDAAKIICNELNKSLSPNIRSHNNSRNWDCVVSEESLGKTFQGCEYGVIIYDKSKNIEILQSNNLNFSAGTKSFSRKPFFVNIKIESSVFLLVTFHIKAQPFREKIKSTSRSTDEIRDISILAAALKQILKPGHKVIMMGDFNQTPTDECFRSLQDANYTYCIDSTVSTNTSKTNGRAYDNFWINKNCEEFYTGISGVIREGLHHAHIPKYGLTGWGGCVSDHCPVFVDFFYPPVHFMG